MTARASEFVYELGALYQGTTLVGLQTIEKLRALTLRYSPGPEFFGTLNTLPRYA
jgi:hypothetical protein